MLLHNQRSRGQAIVVMALAMVAICGMLALAIDAGRLYFQRRLMQDAVDAGALAGAQSLVGTVVNPNGQPNYALYYALDDTLSTFGLDPTNPDPNSPYYTSPVNDTVTDTVGGYTVTAVAPTGYNDKQVQVTVSFDAVATFVQVLGFNRVRIIASATAEAGTNAKTYAIFAYGGLGTGNTINVQGSGYAQVDNGQDGNDFCSGTPSGETISNAKFHMPTGYPGMLNVNGNVFINSADDNQHLGKYWVPAPPFMSGQDPKPNYLIPDTSNLPMAPNRVKINNLASGASTTVGNITVRNTTSIPHDFYIYYPGHYTTSISIPYNPGNDAKNSMYVFANGIYYFTNGASLITTGGYVSNTSTGLPHYGSVAGWPTRVGISDLPPAADGTDGVEFVFDDSGYYSADNSATAVPNDYSTFFVAPNYVPTGSVHIAFYIAQSNTAGTTWSERYDAVSGSANRYQIWGTVFDASAQAMYLTGAQLGPHDPSDPNDNPTDDANPGGPGSDHQYSINGEFIGFTLTLDDGNIQGNAAGATPTCPGPNWTNRGRPALMVQYNKLFAPAPGVNSFLVQ
jgi:Flp pilus assembly protein TadG